MRGVRAARSRGVRTTVMRRVDEDPVDGLVRLARGRGGRAARAGGGERVRAPLGRCVDHAGEPGWSFTSPATTAGPPAGRASAIAASQFADVPQPRFGPRSRCVPATANVGRRARRSTAIAAPRWCSPGSLLNRTSCGGDDVHGQGRHDQVRRGRPAAADDDQAADPRQRGARRAPAQEPRRLLHAHHVRLGRRITRAERGTVVAHRTHVVGEQAHGWHRRSASARSALDRSARELARAHRSLRRRRCSPTPDGRSRRAMSAAPTRPASGPRAAPTTLGHRPEPAAGQGVRELLARRAQQQLAGRRHAAADDEHRTGRGRPRGWPGRARASAPSSCRSTAPPDRPRRPPR